MDPIEILGGLLGGGKSGGGLGGSILKDLLGGGKSRTPAPQRREPTASPTPRRSGDIHSSAKYLEDLLGVAKERHSSRQTAPPTRQPAPSRTRDYSDRSYVGHRDPIDQNDEAVLLIRAMIAAAKSDGRVTREEQDGIIGQLANPTQEAIDFLRREFAKDTTARDVAWSIPLGKEIQAYTVSLAAIQLDERREAAYLRELAHGLRLTPDECNEIHKNCRAPLLYQ